MTQAGSSSSIHRPSASLAAEAADVAQGGGAHALEVASAANGDGGNAPNAALAAHGGAAPAADQAVSQVADFSRAALIALDWGTTSLRAYLYDAAGQVLATHASTAGIMNLPRPAEAGGFDAAFEDACGPWLAQVPGVPVIAAGMVGSAQGWVEAPYVEAPASADALVAGIVRVKAACGVTLHIVPGVLQRGELPNVMRGEETQIFGALSQEASAPDTAAAEFGEHAEGAARIANPASASSMANASDKAHASSTEPASTAATASNTATSPDTPHAVPRTLIGLPGTHAKWAVVQANRIERFHTFMTGEVFAALREHTILGRTMLTPDRPDTVAFLRGVKIARDRGQPGVLATIFSTRTLGLTGELSREQQPDYLSGLLIGHELAGLEAVLMQQQNSVAGQSLRLIGNEALCERYRLALAQFGCTRVELVKHATERGLWRVASQAGLVGPAAHAARPG